VARLDLVVLIPESTRKRAGGSPGAPGADAVIGALPVAVRQKLEGLRAEVLKKSPPGSVDQQGLSGISVKPIDFPGMGRASQPARGEKVAEILRTGSA